MNTRAIAWCLLATAGWAAGTDRGLFDFEGGGPPGAEAQHDARVTVQRAGGNASLRIEGPASSRWPGVMLPAPKGNWDFSKFRYLVVDARNVGPNPVRIGLRYDSRDSDGKLRWRQQMAELAPGEERKIETPIRPTLFDLDGTPIDLPGMTAGPWGRLPQTEATNSLDVAKIPRIMVFAGRPKLAFAVAVDNIRLAGSAAWRGDRPFFPFVDELGQYIHADWPGKTHSQAELAAALKAELADLAAHPGPASFNKWGGWRLGPTLKATGFFRTQKHEGKWWLVDPDGKLFWSSGPSCIRISEEFTPITDRDRWFTWMPRDDPEFKPFFGRCYSSRGRLKGRRMQGFSFGRANMFRRYGDDWQTEAADMAHRRLRSWGTNTLANWSDPSVCLMKRTPYTIAIHCGFGGWLGDRSKVHARFLDVFDPRHEQVLRKRMEREVGKSAGDPWCIGYFVDNELKWHTRVIARGALASPSRQPAKQAFVKMLRARYDSVAALNKAWGTRHASWDALLASTTPPDARKAEADYNAFLTVFAERYFTTVRKVVKEVAPSNLYLGCRFNTFNPEPARVAAKYCDVVSYNYYREPEQVATFEFPGEADVPLVIGEWHFGALDRGWFWEGIRRAKDQADRARKYKLYLRNALAHPQFVGAHWFRYRTQPLTGRPSNGENGQLGFVDICGNPYPELVAAAREVGAGMYEFRAQAR